MRKRLWEKAEDAIICPQGEKAGDFLCEDVLQWVVVLHILETKQRDVDLSCIIQRFILGTNGILWF